MAHFRTDPMAQSYVPPRLSENQLRELEAIIAHSRDASLFAKRVIIWALRRTDGLTRAVSLSMPLTFYGGTARDVQHAAHDMSGVNGSTRLDIFLKLAKTEVVLTHHTGSYSRRADGAVTDNFDERSDGWRTIWWSHVRYDHLAQKLDLPTADELAAIAIA